jgi:hypothetical protein
MLFLKFSEQISQKILASAGSKIELYFTREFSSLYLPRDFIEESFLYMIEIESTLIVYNSYN